MRMTIITLCTVGILASRICELIYYKSKHNRREKVKVLAKLDFPCNSKIKEGKNVNYNPAVQMSTSSPFSAQQVEFPTLFPWGKCCLFL